MKLRLLKPWADHAAGAVLDVPDVRPARQDRGGALSRGPGPAWTRAKGRRIAQAARGPAS
jgi:hypothetical protein